MPEPGDHAASEEDISWSEGQGGAEVRHLPVPVEPLRPHPVEPLAARAVSLEPAGSLPAPLAAAAGGFLVGVATWLLARALRPRRRVTLARASRRQRGLEISGSRSFLVDVHLIKR